MPTRVYRLIGSYIGSLNDTAELVSPNKRKIIKPIASDKFKQYEATEAVAKLRNGRGVINS
jgi:D-arabinose 1-dehydrogenase-like Zn-dependent alcohol dehydrogenase